MEPLFSGLHEKMKAIWQFAWPQLDFSGKAQVIENLELSKDSYV